MDSSSLLRKISIKELSDLGFMREGGPHEIHPRVLQHQKEAWHQSFWWPYARHDLLSKDGAQGAQEVIEGPGFAGLWNIPCTVGCGAGMARPVCSLKESNSIHVTYTRHTRPEAT